MREIWRGISLYGIPPLSIHPPGKHGTTANRSSLSFLLSSPSQVLGTPTREEIRAMNYNYSEFKFPQIKAHPWKGVFRSRTPSEVDQLGWS